jgi:GDP-mannose 6-dehydrogenase
MRISVFGLGYVGSVSAGCLAALGHDVTGVDVNPMKTSLINQGQSPVVEAGLEELICAAVRAGRLRAVTKVAPAVGEADVLLICVGTPSDEGNGSLNLRFVDRVCLEIGQSLRGRNGYPVVVLRSTVLPGTTESRVVPLLEEASHQQAGQDFGVAFNPEFLREGTAVADFYHPAYTVIGQHDPRAADIAASLYASLSAPVLRVPVKVAETVKYANNAFHALKVTFANEIGTLCRAQGIDSHQVMDIFCLDGKLNLSPYYLKPGSAFGGSCLPKDLRALLHHAHHLDLELPVLEAILPSNELHVRRAFNLIRETGRKRVGALGFSFKAGTDDLRESPMVALIETLIGKGYQVLVYDRNVSLARLHGANRAYIEREIPHIATLMRDSPEEVIAASDVIVVGNKGMEFREALQQTRPDQVIIDLVRLLPEPRTWAAQYAGICW